MSSGAPIPRDDVNVYPISSQERENFFSIPRGRDKPVWQSRTEKLCIVIAVLGLCLAAVGAAAWLAHTGHLPFGEHVTNFICKYLSMDLAEGLTIGGGVSLLLFGGARATFWLVQHFNKTNQENTNTITGKELEKDPVIEKSSSGIKPTTQDPLLNTSLWKPKLNKKIAEELKVSVQRSSQQALPQIADPAIQKDFEMFRSRKTPYHEIYRDGESGGQLFLGSDRLRCYLTERSRTNPSNTFEKKDYDWLNKNLHFTTDQIKQRSKMELHKLKQVDLIISLNEDAMEENLYDMTEGKVAHVQYAFDETRNDIEIREIAPIFRMVDEALNNNQTVLFHSDLGNHRSAAFMVLYIMSRTGCSFEDAHQHVYLKRDIRLYKDGQQNFMTAMHQRFTKEAREESLPPQQPSQLQNNHSQPVAEAAPKTVFDSPLARTCLELYKKDEDAWVMVPPKRELQAGKQPSLAMGSTSYPGAGHFKIHINVDPSQMENAIPIVLKVLYQEDAPTVGLKFQTERMLQDDHQVGKEFALIFGEDAETREEETHAIEKLLSKINAAFIEQDIKPERGHVLTAVTRYLIVKLPSGQQPLEKSNLEQRKFDRKILGSEYFHYRNEDFIAVSDTETWAKNISPEERKQNNIVLFSDIDQILQKRPENAHNPLGMKDPFKNLRIS